LRTKFGLSFIHVLDQEFSYKDPEHSDFIEESRIYYI